MEASEKDDSMGSQTTCWGAVKDPTCQILQPVKGTGVCVCVNALLFMTVFFFEVLKILEIKLMEENQSRRRRFR